MLLIFHKALIKCFNILYSSYLINVMVKIMKIWNTVIQTLSLALEILTLMHVLKR